MPRRRDLVYLLAGAAVASGLMVALDGLFRQGMIDRAGPSYRDVALRGPAARSDLPEAYTLPGAGTGDVLFKPRLGDTGLQPCRLPINAELIAAVGPDRPAPRLIRPGGDDERPMLLVELRRRPIVWTERAFDEAMRLGNETCPDGRALVSAEALQQLAGRGVLRWQPDVGGQ